MSEELLLTDRVSKGSPVQGSRFALSSAPVPPLSVAWLHPVIPNYRVPLLQRLAKVPGLQVTSFYGAGNAQFSPPSATSGLTTIAAREVKSYPWPMKGERTLWQAAWHELCRGPYDVIVCQETIHNLTNWALWATRGWHKKKLVFYGYGYRPDQLATGLRRIRDRVRKIFLTSADALIVYTDRGREECCRAGVESKKIFVCGNTLDTEALIPLAQDPEVIAGAGVLRERLRLGGRPVLVYVGRLVPEKRLDVLLHTLRQLRTTMTPEPALLIVGEGASLPQVREQAREIPNVHFLGPIYDDYELAKVFLVADLLVIPGRVGLTCVHGFCYGVPVVTTLRQVEQSPEFDYIRHGENGYVVSEPRVELYQEALTALLYDKRRLRTMKAHAYQTAQSLTMSTMTTQFVAAVRHSVTRA